MKISAKSRYALRILLDISVNGAGEAPRTIKAIAESQDLSEKFISRIVIGLRRSGLVATVRGMRGGLRLARKPDHITLLDVVESVEGPITIIHCLGAAHKCSRNGKCSAQEAWRKVNDGIGKVLYGIKLSDIMAASLAIGPDEASQPEYFI